MKTSIALILSVTLAAACTTTPTTDTRPVDAPQDRATADEVAVEDRATPVDRVTADAPDVPDVPVATDVVDAQTADAPDAVTVDAPAVDAPGDVAADVATDGPSGPTFCSLGTAPSNVMVPEGFCVREFAAAPHARTLTVAPNGDVLVGSPLLTYVTTTGPGIGGVIVYTDDDHDGRGERHDFFTGVADLHGIALGGGYLWYTTQREIYRTPYTTGQRAETPGMREALHIPDGYAGERSTHPLARSVGGVLYSSRSMAPVCRQPIGEIYRVRMGAPTATLDTLARGFRNPMYMRCHFRDEVCACTELGDDGAPGLAKEKLLFLGSGSNYGYPDCHGHDTPVLGCGMPDCAAVTQEEVTFTLNDTPFGFDWERGAWPAPYRDALFVAQHGSFYNPYRGAGVWWVPADPTTHRPRTNVVQPFVTGFGNPTTNNERPADVAFSPDGRMFFTVDQGNKVYWVAPTTLRMPAR